MSQSNKPIVNATELASLTNEKSLWHLYLVYRQNQKIGYFNFYFTLGISFILFIFTSLNDSTIDEWKIIIKEFSDFSVQIVASILGFLIAGYTIFLTLIKSKHVKLLNAALDPENNLPIFKSCNLAFVNVFIQYLAYFVVGLLIKTLNISGNRFHELCIFCFDEQITQVIFKTVYFILALWTIVLGLYLKSFVFNIYISAMILFSLDMDDPEDDA